MSNKDTFYVKTKDETLFGVYNLHMSDESNGEITFDFGAVGESDETEPYESEVQEIVKDLIEKSMSEFIKGNS
jgi:hypothetical protein